MSERVSVSESSSRSFPPRFQMGVRGWARGAARPGSALGPQAGSLFAPVLGNSPEANWTRSSYLFVELIYLSIHP